MSRDPRPEDSKRKPARAGFLAWFLGDRRGSTAIEFSLLALPFALLVFAILESCISLAGQEVMANATADVARQLRTGQLLPADVDETKLKSLICARMEIMVAKGCPGLKVDLRAFDTFAAAADASFSIVDKKIVLTGVADTTFKVEPGLAESKNMLRVFYEWPVMTDFMAARMANLEGGKTLHFASVTWQNEPFNN